MPVEVKELVIKAVVDEQMKNGKTKKPSEKIDRDEIIEDCVEQVLEILKKEKER